MTIRMLDTTIISDLIRPSPGEAAKRFATVNEDNICISMIKPIGGNDPPIPMSSKRIAA